MADERDFNLGGLIGLLDQLDAGIRADRVKAAETKQLALRVAAAVTNLRGRARVVEEELRQKVVEVEALVDGVRALRDRTRRAEAEVERVRAVARGWVASRDDAPFGCQEILQACAEEVLGAGE